MTTTKRRRDRDAGHRADETPQSPSARVVRRHPLATFFVLTYLMSWALWAPLVVFRGDLPTALGFVLLVMGSLVPSTVAVILVAVLHGRRGVRQLFHRLVMARVGLRWYVAVLALPLLAPLAVGLSVMLGGSAPAADNTVIGILVLFAFSIFPGSALGEELGWRGFALPDLQVRHSALRASLVIGLVWGFWHLPTWLRGNEYPLALFAPFVVSVVAMSVLCTWLYNSTGGSLLIVVLFHATANLPISVLITPLGDQMPQPFLIYTALMVVTAAAVVAATGAEHLSRTRTKQVSGRWHSTEVFHPRPANAREADGLTG